ncbi:protein of unknown function [Denitratisoma oestradiolicum]|uniref:N-acetyltransferase domain-containing protein n=2 Tax=Denitratisoma oestradiolicum TaxID=311182 RepID=A0A6S6Y556_9PROT|nr:protein of unknown function [Denitratisoma oestradiolicum]
MYIGIADDGRKIGICRFDYLPAETTAEVFLTLNPEMRGMGLSSELLRMSIDTLSEPLGPDTRLWAKIRKQNVPSVRCFLAAGFQQCSHKEDWVFFTRSL